MKILYDDQIFSFQRYGGISKYFCELINNLHPENDIDLSVILTDNYHLRQQSLTNRLCNVPFDFRGKPKLYKMVNQLFSSIKVQNNNYDIFHPTYFNTYFLSKIKKPFVITVHDLTVENYKDTFFKKHTKLIENKRELIIASTRIIAISEYTKNDLIRFYDVDPDKIDVVYHGYNPTSTTKKIVNNKGNYILYVGTRDTYKNFIFFIESIVEILHKEQEIKVICVGSAFSAQESHFLSLHKLSNRVEAIQASNEILNQLYENALFFIYPSLYEGFGMPILEAFACNCPVVLSNTTCFPEIAGCAAEYFNPLDRDSIRSSVLRVLNEAEYRTTLRKLGRERLGQFSWKETAINTFNTYQKCL